MSRKFAFPVAIALCVALAFAPVLAERGVDGKGDRSKQGVTQRAPAEQVNWLDTFDEMFLTPKNKGGRGTTVDNTATSKASGLVEAAGRIGGDEAISMLQQVRSMGLVSSEENDKILAQANLMLGDLYEGSGAKQVSLYARALQYTSDPGLRSRLETQITVLGGDVFALSFGQAQAATNRAPGADDDCIGATAAQPFHVETMNIDPAGDHNWRFYDVPSGTGWTVRIETVAPVPGSTDYDTNLTLWGGCNGATGEGTDFIAFNDDSSLANAPFMSRIDTECLAPGTYYIDVGGFDDITVVPDFDLEVEMTTTCEVALPDAFEPDDDKSDDPLRAGRDTVNGDNGYADIGYPTAIPAHANGWGRSKKEIQARNTVPGSDSDFAQLRLTQNAAVRMATAAKFGTFFNDFAGSGPGDNPDTVIQVYYNKEYDYGGLCNEPDVGFTLNRCLTDQDCIDACNGSFPCNGSTVPGFPPCMPFYFFNLPFDGNPIVGHINDLGINDDADPGVNLGSNLLLCLPRTSFPSDSATANGDWIVRVNPWNAADVFDYELQVKNEAPCRFEVEPNQSFATANPYEIGEVVHGINDHSVNAGSNVMADDSDLWVWDVDEESLLTFDSLGYDANAVDTLFQLIVGPDDNGDFFLLLTDDDGGAGYLSNLTFIAPPANDLLGNVVNDADYYMNVTTQFFNPNFPYTMVSSASAVPAAEAEPNNAPAEANAMDIGDTILGDLSSCDRDVFRLSLSEATYVTAATGGTGDTAIRILGSDLSMLSCDDDSGDGVLSLSSGCLEAGDYYVEVRAFSGFSSFSYELSVDGVAGCAPLSPPDVTGDSGLTCAAFDTCP